MEIRRGFGEFEVGLEGEEREGGGERELEFGVRCER